LGAQRAGEIDGDYVECVLKSAAAAEVLIKHCAWMLGWEVAHRPRQSSSMRPLMTPRSDVKPATLIGKVLAPLLKGDWSSKSSDRPVGAWRTAIAQPRNAVIHLGQRPSHEEARHCLASLDLLEQHVLDRLAASAQLYPLTCLFLLGTSGLERRAAYGKVRATARATDIAAQRTAYLSWLEACLTNLAVPEAD
jgi:hypothetical protein